MNNKGPSNSSKFAEFFLMNAKFNLTKEHHSFFAWLTLQELRRVSKEKLRNAHRRATEKEKLMYEWYLMPSWWITSEKLYADIYSIQMVYIPLHNTSTETCRSNRNNTKSTGSSGMQWTTICEQIVLRYRSNDDVLQGISTITNLLEWLKGAPDEPYKSCRCRKNQPAASRHEPLEHAASFDAFRYCPAEFWSSCASPAARASSGSEGIQCLEGPYPASAATQCAKLQCMEERHQWNLAGWHHACVPRQVYAGMERNLQWEPKYLHCACY